MTERVHIRQRYREEFEQIGEIDLRKRLEAGQFDDDKRKAGWAWLDDKAHGEERGLQGQATRLARAQRFENQYLAGLRACCPDHLRCRTVLQQPASKRCDATGHHAEALAPTQALNHLYPAPPVPALGRLQRCFTGQDLRPQPSRWQIIPVEELGFAAVRKANFDEPHCGTASCLMMRGVMAL